jgi:hypothetical protein
MTIIDVYQLNSRIQCVNDINDLHKIKYSWYSESKSRKHADKERGGVSSSIKSYCRIEA